MSNVCREIAARAAFLGIWYDMEDVGWAGFDTFAYAMLRRRYFIELLPDGTLRKVYLPMVMFYGGGQLAALIPQLVARVDSNGVTFAAEIG